MKAPLETFKTPDFPVKGKPDTLPAPLQEVTVRKSTKDEVAYQNTPKKGKRCLNCTHFDAPVACYGVNGTISPDGWCKHYDEIKSMDLPIKEG
jgi:hypothetical protein